MRILLRRTGLIAGRVLLAICAFAVAEFIGVSVAFSGGIVLLPFAPVLVLLGLVGGLAGLLVGLVRRRRGAASGGIGGFDLLLHAVLLANTLLIGALLLLQGLVPGDLREPLLGGVVVAGSSALVGVPLSVALTWTRAFARRDPVPSRREEWVLRCSHAANVVLAVCVAATSSGSVTTLLLGSTSI